MTLYVESSALCKIYIDEPGTDVAQRYLELDPDWVSANHTYTEVFRALHLLAPEDELTGILEKFLAGWHRMLIVSLDDPVCRRAGVLATVTGTRTLDALHLAAVERSGGLSLPILTFDVRLATAARSLGYTVLGS